MKYEVVINTDTGLLPVAVEANEYYCGEDGVLTLRFMGSLAASFAHNGWVYVRKIS